jgi:hypothetical protein
VKEARNKFDVKFFLSSLDGWTDRSGQQKSGRLIEELGDRVP